MPLTSPEIKASEATLSPESLEGRPGKKPFGANAGKVLAGIGALLQLMLFGVLCVFGLELVFALTHVGENEFLMPDKVMGYTLMPDKIVTQRKEGYGHFLTNSYGMQDDEVTLAKPPGTLRIAVFGDSYVEALHVPRQANFLRVCAAQLSEKLHQPVQVLNFGVSNYSVAQDYLRYKNLARKFHPDLVVQVFRVDESEKLLPQTSVYLPDVKPVFFAGPHGELIYDDTNVKYFLNSSTGKKLVKNHWFRHNSRLYGVIGQIMSSMQAPGKGAAVPAVAAAAAVGAESQKNAASAADTAAVRARFLKCYWYMMDRQLQQFAADCRADGAAFMILRTPMLKAEMTGVRSNPVEDELLNQTATQMGAPVLDLDTMWKKQFGTKNDSDHFFRMGHFTRATHAWVGSRLADYLAQNQKIFAAGSQPANSQNFAAGSQSAPSKKVQP